MSPRSLFCVAAFGLLTARETRALLVPPRGGFVWPRGSIRVPAIPKMAPRMCDTARVVVRRA